MKKVRGVTLGSGSTNSIMVIPRTAGEEHNPPKKERNGDLPAGCASLGAVRRCPWRSTRKTGTAENPLEDTSIESVTQVNSSSIEFSF
ncbi:hypothetical protein CDAR_387911 [Caerostris darwini]|uniref:Uncharacterized protein n=1 Tax=Caerostris darwini TaxID=1538125 RepID=A0AAV4SX63_9ARAC|nr:hypothetical protein CDAR_387911 [Caerostris darwini]